MKYWLLKSEPQSYSIEQMAKDNVTSWTGIRNYQARNFMTQQMSPGDLCLFYHSNAKPPACVGVVRVKDRAHPDPTALDKKSEYFDPKASLEKPIWECVDVEFVEQFNQAVSLNEIKATPTLAKMELLKRENRLSIQTLTAHEFKVITKLGGTRVHP